MCLLLLLLTFLRLQVSNCLSACDEIHITYFLDTSLIINDHESIINFISDIIWDGSSEYTSLSIYLYGDFLAPEMIQNPKIMDGWETYRSLYRQVEVNNLMQLISKVHDDIWATDPKQRFHMPLNKVFNMATKQYLPERSFKKTRILSQYGAKIGINDGDHLYFILDSTLEMLNRDNYKPTCEILKYFSSQEISNEKIHIFSKASPTKNYFICQDNRYSLKKGGLVFTFDQHANDPNIREQILDITCPGKIQSDDHNGDINVANQVEYLIDSNVIIKCKLHERGNKLRNDSVMIVKDFYHDDMTFKVNHYIILDKKMYQNAILMNPKNGLKGCTHPIFKVISVTQVEKYESYQILELGVQLPQSPLEYILESNISMNNTDLNSRGKNSDDKRQLITDLSWSETNYNFLPSIFPFSRSYIDSWNKTIESTYELGPLKISGSGSIKLDYGITIDITMLLDFEFVWKSLFSNDVKIYYKIHGKFEAHAWFYVKINAQLEIELDLLDYNYRYFLWIGPIPVIIKPFITLTAKLATIPLEFFGGINCTYIESYESGYYYEDGYAFVADHSFIKGNASWNTRTIEEWGENDGVDSFEKCLRASYNHYENNDEDSYYWCKLFEWNEKNKICRCKGNEDFFDALDYESGTNAYLLGFLCDKPRIDCADDCDVIVEFRKYNKSCSDGYVTCMDCDQTHTWYNDGGEYKNITIEYHITKNDVIKSQCLPTLKFGDPDQDGCFNQELGFNVTIDTKIGVILYEFITLYLRIETVFPYRLILPDIDEIICNGLDVDSCILMNKISGSADIYMGLKTNFKDLFSVVYNMAFYGEDDGTDSNDFNAPETLLLQFDLFNLSSPICFNNSLNFSWAPLIDFLQYVCCGKTDTTSLNPTNYPSFSPTKYPTALPTIFPTNLPTNNPSFSPTISPTMKPSTTMLPTMIPTTLTIEPTVTIADHLTLIPTSNPTLSPLNEEYYFSFNLSMSQLSNMSASEMLFNDSNIKNTFDLLLQNAFADLIGNNRIFTSIRVAKLSTNARRLLVSTIILITIICDDLIVLRNIYAYIISGQDKFVNSFNDDVNSFYNTSHIEISLVSVENIITDSQGNVYETTVEDDNKNNNNETGGLNTGIIILIVLLSILLLTVIILVVWWLYNRRKINLCKINLCKKTKNKKESTSNDVEGEDETEDISIQNRESIKLIQNTNNKQNNVVLEN